MFPITCEIDTSNKCQNQCNFCMFSEYRKDNAVLDVKVYQRLLTDLQKIGTRAITFTGGGEPLTNPFFEAMAIEAYRKGFKIGLITNGIGLDKLKQFNIFEFIRISLDAATCKTYKRIKKTTKFDSVVKNILALPDGLDVGISYVVCKENEHEVEHAKDLAKKFGVKYIQFKPVYGTNWTSTNHDEGIIITNRFKVESTLPCYIAGLVGVVGADGSVWYCCQKRGQSDFLLGNLHDKPFSEIWTERDRVSPDVTECVTCRYQNYVEELYNPTPSIRHRWFL